MTTGPHQTYILPVMGEGEAVGEIIPMNPRARLTQHATRPHQARKPKKEKLAPIQVDPDLKDMVSEYAALEGIHVKDVVREAMVEYKLKKRYVDALQRKLSAAKGSTGS